MPISKFKVPFGLKGERLYRPAEMVRGLACGCTCPKCGCALVANLGNGKKKRPYFSHHRAPECSGGFETAIHLMAKQVIEKRLMFVLPAYEQTFSAPDPEKGLIVQELSIPSRRIDFATVRVEVTIDGFRPDIVGMTESSEQFLIEVFVTHAVTDEKKERYKDRNLIELDLSGVSQDQFDQENLFEDLVLNEGPRVWVACQIYKDQIADAKEKLNSKFEDRVRAYRDQERKRQEIIERKQLHRAKWQSELKSLELLTSKPPVTELANETRTAICQSLELATIPDYLNYRQTGDWAINAPRVQWQAYVFKKYILGRRGEVLTVLNVRDSVLKRYPLLSWVSDLIKLKKQHAKARRRDSEAWGADYSTAFLNEQEINSIPSPFRLIKDFLNNLALFGFLSTDLMKDGEYLVVAESENEKETKRLEIEKRKAEIVQSVRALYRSRISFVNRCNDCWHHQSIQLLRCERCQCHNIEVREITKDYIDNIVHRVRFKSLKL